MEIPPWLNIHPSDYLNALHAGMSQGLAIAEARNRAQAQAEEMAARREEMAQRQAEAMTAHQERQRESDLRRWEFEQQMAMEQKRLAAEEARRQAELGARTAYQTSNLDFRREMEKRRLDTEAFKEREAARKASMGKLHFGPNGSVLRENADGNIEVVRQPEYKPATDTVTEKIPAVEGTPEVPAQAARSGFLGIGARPAVPFQPAVPATPERTITRRVPVGGLSAALGAPAPGMLPAPSTPTTPYKEGTRLKNKKDGKTYVVTNGVPVPEEEKGAPAIQLDMSQLPSHEEDNADDELE